MFTGTACDVDAFSAGYSGGSGVPLFLIEGSSVIRLNSRIVNSIPAAIKT
jgi:hypothetical protein